MAKGISRGYAAGRILAGRTLPMRPKYSQDLPRKIEEERESFYGPFIKFVPSEEPRRQRG